MEYFKNLYNYYFVKETKKDTQTIVSEKIEKIKPFDVNSFDNEVINKINFVMFKKH